MEEKQAEIYSGLPPLEVKAILQAVEEKPEDMRQFGLDDPSFKNLNQEVEKVFDTKHVILHWKDGSGELISITNEEEFHLAVTKKQAFQGNVFIIYIKGKLKKQESAESGYQSALPSPLDTNFKAEDQLPSAVNTGDNPIALDTMPHSLHTFYRQLSFEGKDRYDFDEIKRALTDDSVEEAEAKAPDDGL